ncbi:ATPase [Planococcus glaciei]|uniref:ATP-binding protein n=1 Tax=Planococcus glaciei TaxID=459472 RepID=UPI00069E4F87|nr:sensor histidine kinase [Planococcus glaciei]KOF08695.1 ATPase [Planococcus glaciei]
MTGINKIPLQTKILGLISALVFFIVILLAGIFAYLESIDTRAQVEQLALQTAKTIALMPELREGIEQKDIDSRFRPIAEQVKDQVNAADIVIENREEIIYSHVDSTLISQKSMDPANYQALIFGGSNNFEVARKQGSVLTGKVPVIADYGEYTQIIGTVSVEFLERDIYQSITERIKMIGLASLAVVLLGIIGGVLLAKSIRNDTLGLEPHEIASLYRERNAILLSVKEGIIAIDGKGFITLINHSAKSMLNLDSENLLGQPIKHFLHHIKIDDVLRTEKAVTNAEVPINEKTFIFNIIPIIENGTVAGAVSSFRDKTELKSLMNTITEVREYSDGLRAQTHEYANKLFLLSGLLQLDRHQEALEFIQKESVIHQQQNQVLFNQIHDTNVQAVLLGKISKASEKKILLEIDAESYIDPFPVHIEAADIAIIIGNLLDNAFDAVEHQLEKKVAFSITGVGSEIIIEVTDNGKGISSEALTSLFTLGYSSKGDKRGYGLFNVKRIVESLGGTVEVNNMREGRTIFTVYLPKNREGQQGAKMND